MNVEEAPDYEKMVDIVDSVDQASAETTIPIDVSDVFQNRIEVRELKYEDVEQILEKTDTRRFEVPQIQARQRIQPQQMQPKVQSTQPKTRMQPQFQTPQPQMRVRETPQMQPQAQPSQPQPQAAQQQPRIEPQKQETGEQQVTQQPQAKAPQMQPRARPILQTAGEIFGSGGGAKSTAGGTGGTELEKGVKEQIPEHKREEEAIMQVQPQARAPQMQPRTRATKQNIGNEMAEAAGRLKNMMGAAGTEFEKGVKKEIVETKVEKQQTVMPKLSLQDQVSDLEKIEEGIGEDAFDDEQIEIIKQEINALSLAASKEMMSRLSWEQKQLALLRNQKIKEIRRALNMN